MKIHCLLFLHDGAPIEPEHGGPVRLIIPQLYAWKSAKWIKGVRFLAEDQAGFWEEGGYHMRGQSLGGRRRREIPMVVSIRRLHRC
mgnify:CR=1 FL=1